MRSRSGTTVCGVCALGAMLALATGCKNDKSTADPDKGSNLLGASARDAGEDDFSGDDDLAADEDPFGFEDDVEPSDDGEIVAEGAPKKKLPPRSKMVEKCTGKGKARTCDMVDPTPKVSAAYGVAALMGEFSWGATPGRVLKLLSKDVEDEYAKRQNKAGKNAQAQDRNRKWRQVELNAIKANHVKFTKASKHRWAVSLIQFEYEDDANEEMVWVNTGTGLRKFYFFKDDELWKVLYGYSTDVWPGKSYDDVVEEKFKKWFGPSPKALVKSDPKTDQPALTYYEWEGLEDEKIRSFDLSEVHGIIALVVIDGRVEGRLGQRLPNLKRETRTSDVVKGVLGGSDVCYSEDGTIRECSEEEASGIE